MVAVAVVDSRVLQQVEQVEGAVRRALGEIPRRRRTADGPFGVAAVAGADAAAPGERPLDGQPLLRFHQRRERLIGQREGLETSARRPRS